MGVAEELALIFSLKFMGDLRQIEDVSHVSECPLYCSCCVLRFYLGKVLVLTT